MPYTYKNNEIEIEKIKNKYIKINKDYTKFYNYFIKEWIPYFNNGILIYNHIEKKFSINSYIENYIRTQKIKLSELFIW